MIYRRCGRCGGRIPSGTVCPCCKREYAKPDGVARFYHTAQWRRTRDYVMARHDGVDLYALEVHKVLKAADTVHHITPLKEDYSKRMDIYNLIPVSRESHDEIERIYSEGDRRGLQYILQQIVMGHMEGRGGS